jgi:type I restriction enzyme S subunit
LRLNEICAAIVDCEHNTAPEGDGYALSVGTRAMKDGRLVLDACKPVSQETFIGWSRRMMPVAGDLVLAREAPVGQVVRVPRTPRICLGQRTVLIRPDAARVYPRFLHYWLLGPDAQGPMAEQAAGATVPHLNVEDIRRLDVTNLPQDRKHQRAAAETLGTIDDLIETNRRRVELLEEMARAIYREWFVHFRQPGHENAALVDSALGPIPEGWDVAGIGSLGRVVTGSTPSSKEPSFWGALGDTPFLTPSEMSMHRLWAEPIRFLSAAGVASVRSRVLPAGAVCFSCIGSIGKIALTVEPTVTNQQVNSIIVDDRTASTAFAFHSLSSAADSIRLRASGAATPIINKSAFSAIRILVPSPARTHEFARAVDPLHSLVLSIERQNLVLAATRDLLLPWLVTGQIDVSTLDLDALAEDSAA